jgi:hypothetical protein
VIHLTPFHRDQKLWCRKVRTGVAAPTVVWFTSGWGQTEKNSVRAFVFRFALKLGHGSMQSPCLKGANPGLPLNEIISPGADPGQGGDYAKACSHVCSDPEIFHFRTPTQIQR